MSGFRRLIGVVLTIALALAGSSSLYAKGKPHRAKPAPHHKAKKPPVKAHKAHKAHKPAHKAQHKNPAKKHKPRPKIAHTKPAHGKAKLKQPPRHPKPLHGKGPVHSRNGNPHRGNPHRGNPRVGRSGKPIPTNRNKPRVHAARVNKRPGHIVPAKDKKNPETVRRDDFRFRPRAPLVTENRHERIWDARHWKTYGFSGFNESTGSFHFNPGSWNSFVQGIGSSVGGGSRIGGGRVVGGVPGGGIPVNGNGAEVININIVPPLNVAARSPIIKIGESMPMGKGGKTFAAVLDGFDVENHWLPGKIVDWKTGNVTEESGSGPSSHAGAFVLAVCARMKAPMPATSDTSIGQYEWLMAEGKDKNWMKVAEAEAQLLANQGWVVIAAWKNMAEAGDRDTAAHTAIVRPDSQPTGEILKRGPRVIMAGPRNYNDVSIKDGFPADAWKKYEIVYLAHPVR